MTDRETSKLASSSGHAMSSADHLDNHYLVKQPEYEATLRSVGLKAGWHVLDAGCGGGSFLPLMAELVGQDGQISALDLAPEVTQYLTDTELNTAMAEFRRVVRPGGLVAIKDVDVSGTQFQPLEPMLLWRLIESQKRAANTYILGLLRGMRLPGWLRAAGLTQVQRQTTLVERWSPLSPNERALIGSALGAWAERAGGQDIPEEDRLAWKEVAEAPDRLMDRPDFWVVSHSVV